MRQLTNYKQFIKFPHRYNFFVKTFIFCQFIFFSVYFFQLQKIILLNFPYMNVLNSAPPPIKYEITLPKINFKKIKTSRVPSKDNVLKFSKEQCSEELAKLDQWTNSLPTVRIKTYQPSQSIMFLYKSNNKYYGHGNRPSQNREAVAVTIGMYLAQLETQLAKVQKINYDAIYQNVQYCAGVYEIVFNEILKKLQNMKKMLKDNLKEKLKNIEQFREKKINEMRAKKQVPTVHVSDKRSQYEKSYFLRQNSKLRESEQNENNSQQSTQNKLALRCRENIEKQEKFQKNKMLVDFKQAIEDKYQELQPIKIILKKLEKARIRVLYFSLELGFDVRQEGLTWILKQINKKPASAPEQNKQNIRESQGLTPQTPLTIDRQNRSKHRDSQTSRQKQDQKIIPKISQFPNFLTEQQINFIISKFKNDFKLKIIQTEKLSKEEQQKAILQNAFENVRRDRTRKLSMIKEKQLLEKLLNEKRCEVAVGHKYITCETVRLMQNSQKIKYTKNELIYKQALRKLSRFCIKQINNKKQKGENSPLNNSKGSRRSSKKSISSLMGRRSTNENSEQMHKIMDEVKKMLSEANKLKDKEQKIKNQEQKQLADILMKLRNERYEGRVCSDRRNPISVIACLVGWKKAKKIIQNEMNISMFTSTQN